MKVRMGALDSRCGQHDSVRWLHWGEWESREANVRGGGEEGGRTAASAHTGSGRQARQRHSIFITLIHISSAAKPLPPQPAEPSGSLRRASPPTTHFSSGTRLFLARPREKLPFRSFSYLPQFLEYLMENGDLRAAVRAFLPPRSPNCTSHTGLFADRRDPPLPTALHVSTLSCRGIDPVKVRGSGTGGPAEGRCVHNGTLLTRMLMFRQWWPLVFTLHNILERVVVRLGIQIGQ